MNGHEIIALLAPPIQVVEHMTAVFELNRKKGHPTPQACLDWLALWQSIRSADKTPIDGTTPATWAEVETIVKREMVTA